ncbi:MAG TPA: hypothetical protein VMS53_01340, partial [Burkholderiales bacterium]|nr:hypothetical protein [Burkholderiales bacterium]
MLALVLCAGGARAQQEEKPELRYLESGKANYSLGKYALAARDLRLARFMSLDVPARHLEIVARLAVAEDAAGAIAARDASLSHFLEVEALFPEYEAASLEPDVQQRFQALLLKRYSRDRILATPALAEELGLIPRTTSGRRPTATRPAAASPTSLRLPETRTPAPERETAAEGEPSPVSST